ncbi:MAG: glutathione S-transferase family protein [Myxococcales bacterium]|nr:glutathione S-transferase family protein [Myxococcales bacterium]
MTITLHGVPGTRSTRAQWLLEELGVPYEHHKLDFMKGEHKGEAHLARHRHGLVPSMDLGTGPMIESAAMCLALADFHENKLLAPKPTSPARARYYEAIVYAISTLDECVIPLYFHKKVLPEAQRDAQVIAAKEPTWKVAADVLTDRLGDKPYLCGQDFTAADVVVGYDLVLALEIGLLKNHLKLADYTQRLMARPAFKRAFPM